MFNFDLSDKLKVKIRKVSKKDKTKSIIINKKIKEIIKSDKKSINKYKNLRYEMKDYKRVHIDRHFVLIFKVYINKNFILFIDFEHHDNVY